VENATIAEMHDVPACPLSGSAGTAVRRGVHEGEVKVTERQAAELFRCPVVYIADDDNVYMPALWPVLRRVMRVALFSTGNLAHDAIEVSLSQTCKMPSSQSKALACSCGLASAARIISQPRHCQTQYGTALYAHIMKHVDCIDKQISARPKF
jgi:hypothetical protein